MADEYTPIIDDEWWDRRFGGSAEKRTIARLKAENAKLRELVIRMRPTCMQGKRCTFADKLYISKAIEELGIEASK